MCTVLNDENDEQFPISTHDDVEVDWINTSLQHVVASLELL